MKLSKIKKANIQSAHARTNSTLSTKTKKNKIQIITKISSNPNLLDLNNYQYNSLQLKSYKSLKFIKSLPSERKNNSKLENEDNILNKSGISSFFKASQIKSQLSSINDEIDVKNEEVNSLISFVNDLKKEIKNIQNNISKISKEKDQYEEKINNLNIRIISRVTSESEEKSKKIEKLNKEISNSTLSLDNITKENIQLKSKIQDEETLLKEVTAIVNKVKNESMIVSKDKDKQKKELAKNNKLTSTITLKSHDISIKLNKLIIESTSQL